MIITIITDSGEKKVEIGEKRTLSDILSLGDLGIAKPCAGRGTCGKCKVEAHGSLSPLSQQESDKLTASEKERGIRLACRAYAEGDAVIKITDSGEISGITEGKAVAFRLNPLTGSEDCYAAAADIGTTTVAIYIYKMPECECVKTLCVPNSQSRFGADVISRTEYAMKGGLAALGDAIRGQICEALASFGKKISRLVMTGNTTMLHFYAGESVDRLSAYPFEASSLFGEWRGNDYLVRCVSAYVGADITCAVLASGMLGEKNSLLIDIGTNGEMAYNSHGGLICCSTAAGPAFEGAGISSGMLASPRAIDRVYIVNGKTEYTVIGGGRAKGICGSGLIDAVKCLLALGEIDETGRMEQPVQIGNSGVFITPEDVRQVQLAKAAIRAGIDTLCPDISEVGSVYIAGGFGSFVDIESCADIGMIPREIAAKVCVIGNAAGSGAAMILQSRDCLRESEQIAKAARTRELSADAQFMEKYIENMHF